MDIRKFLKRKTTSSDYSVSSKRTENISWDKDEKKINVSTNWNNEGVEEDGLSNDIFYCQTKNLVIMKSLNASVLVSQAIPLIIRQNNINIHGESPDL